MRKEFNMGYKRKALVPQPETAVVQDPDAVTKKDLAGVVYKKDLAEYVKRAEISKFVTDKELRGLATKDDLGGFVTEKGLNQYVCKGELDILLEKRDYSQYARKDELSNFVTKQSLSYLVSHEELAKIVNPSKLAQFLKKGDLAGLATKEELGCLARKDAVVSLDSPKPQAVAGGLTVSGPLVVNGNAVKTSAELARRSVRVFEAGPAQLTKEDEVVIILNKSNALFGVNLPKGELGQEIVIKDGLGNSYDCEIKVVCKPGASIDGKPAVFIRENYGKLRLVFNGSTWNVV
jgi:hypothetical protein